MATKEDWDKLLGKVLSDAAFREEFIKDPAAAAKKASIDLTPEQAEALTAIDPTCMKDVLEKIATPSGVDFCLVHY